MATTTENVHATYCQKFNLQNICKGTNTIINGRRLTGKSQLLCEIIQGRSNSKVAIFASKYVSPSYKKYFSPDKVYDEYEPRRLKRLIDEQYQSGPDAEELIIAFDDVASMNKELWKDPVIRDIIRYGSSMNITSIFSIQWPGQLDDMFKRNIDYVFCFRDNILDNQRLMFTEFAGMFATFNDFKMVLEECIAEPYRCLVFDLKTPRKDPRMSVFWYKANTLQRYIPTSQSSTQSFKATLWKWLDFF